MPSTSQSAGGRAVLVLRSVGFIAIGVVVGAAAFFVTPTTYTAEARVGIGQSNLTAAQVPGYAAAVETLANDYARFVQDTSAERNELDPTTHLVKQVSATPIPGSSVIRVQVDAASSRVAIAAANAAAKKLIDQIGTATASVTGAEKSFSDAYIAYLKAKASAEAATATSNALLTSKGPQDAAYQAALSQSEQLNAAAAVLNVRQLALASAYQTAFTNSATTSTVTLVRTASDTTSNATANAQKTIGVGLVAGVALAIIVEYFRRRRIAASTGAEDARVADAARD